jgi:AcrR family transcriptional regulator
MSKEGLRSEQTEATRRALLRSARWLFARRGYTAVSTEEIVRRARVTRGALYHHFAGKQDLFRTVVKELNAELVERIAGLALAEPDPWSQMHRGAEAFLDACLEPEVQRIVLIDAPAVLGWEAWRELDAEAGLGLVQAVLDMAMESGAIERQPVKPLAHLLLGALDEAALLVARAADVQAARAEMGQTIAFLLAGLRRADAPTGGPRSSGRTS